MIKDLSYNIKTNSLYYTTESESESSDSDSN